MPTTNQRKIKSNLQRIRTRDDRVILVLCFAAAVIWWLAGTLSDNHTRHASIPIDLELPDQYALATPVPSLLRVTIEGSGWDLIGAGNDIRTLKIRPVINKTGITYLSSNSIIQSLNEKLENASFKVVAISSDGLNLDVDDRISMEVPVIPRIGYKLGKEFMIKSDLVVDPNSISISGPSQILEQMEHLYTDSLALGTLEQSVQQKIGIALANPELFNLSQDEVEVKLEIEKYTEKALLIPIRKNPQNPNIQLIPDKVLCKMNVGLSRYDDLTANAFRCSVDLTSIDGQKQLIVRIDSMPEFGRYIDHSPKVVDYVIKE